MGLPAQALKLMDQSLLVVLSHGGHYDQAQAMALFVKCKVASSASMPQEIRTEVIAESVRLLKKVKESYRQVDAHSKVKETVYLQVCSFKLCYFNIITLCFLTMHLCIMK